LENIVTQPLTLGPLPFVGRGVPGRGDIESKQVREVSL
jgi:hypothetical protein